MEWAGVFSGIVMGTLVHVVVSIQRYLLPSPGQVYSPAILEQLNWALRLVSGHDSKSCSGFTVVPHVV